MNICAYFFRIANKLEFVSLFIHDYLSKLPMRLLLFTSFCSLFANEIWAQQGVFRSQSVNLAAFSNTSKSSNESGNAKSFIPSAQGSQNISKKTALIGTNIFLIPLFGGFEKSVEQKEKVEEFLKSCDKSFKNRSEASDFFATRAWEYLSEGEKDTATHRFNLAYLLDDENAEAYWGLGVIAYQNQQYEQAIELMNKGLDMDDDDNVTLIVDLSTVYLKCFTVDNNHKDLENAFNLLHKALNKQPDAANALMQLSMAKLLNNELDEAWERFHEGYELDPENANIEILEALLSKKDDPKGIFHKNN